MDHRKQIYGAVAAYRFGGFGMLGYMIEREEKVSDGTDKTNLPNEKLTYVYEDKLLPLSKRDSDNMNAVRLKDDAAIVADFPIYYQEDTAPDKTGKSEQDFQEVEESDNLIPLDVDIVGSID
ncbi:hypothetical protein DdX_03549 [Ditylenchus destructor]|uniref:Uncharacterized protein n=1 Tax=Ditylenchus destructor TaxID=166010 RepID=A0AAD4N8Z1_9BILA|nr:hypothetical protein DdX_03549 [Ditylenchus destructor]